MNQIAVIGRKRLNICSPEQLARRSHSHSNIENTDITVKNEKEQSGAINKRAARIETIRKMIKSDNFKPEIFLNETVWKIINKINNESI